MSALDPRSCWWRSAAPPGSRPLTTAAATLAAAIVGWSIGSRSRLADADTDDVDVRV